MTSATMLLRQVHPDFIPDGQLTSQAFIPFPKDSCADRSALGMTLRPNGAVARRDEGASLKGGL
jgi:hypothetical protein